MYHRKNEGNTCFSFSQDSASCGGHSSSGSTSSLSTPPSVSQSPPQPQLNGIAAVGTTPAGLGGVAGLMGALGAGSALGMGGIVGALNGVIQTPGGTASPHTHTTGAATGVTLPVNNRYVWSFRNLFVSPQNWCFMGMLYIIKPFHVESYHRLQ